MAEWEGKSRGTPLGYKIFVWTCKHLGVAPAYFILRLVAFYFFLFYPSSTSPIYNYFRKRFSYGVLKSLVKTYRNNYLLGQTLIDKIVMIAGLKIPFTFNFDGEENLHQMVATGRGGILLSAHAGNWEMAGQHLTNIKTIINIVMFDGEHENIKQYMDGLGEKSFNVITIKDDMSHVYQMGAALGNNELICMHADRFLEGNKTVSINFLGEEARFPIGPFLMSAGFNVPVSLVFAFKEPNNHYHYFGSPLIQRSENENKKDFAQRLAQLYVQDLEKKLREYPEQWFNYYDFWKK
jgi:predicted LPLAT superfamily acyltransferase